MTPPTTIHNDDNAQTASVFGWRSLVLACGLLALVVVAGYVVPEWVRGGELVLPLDDVYIHMQYAAQIARGEVYVYNPGLPPSSGATSLLYPYLLALGHVVGLRELALGWWVLAIGTGALAVSCGFIARIAQKAGLGRAGVVLLAASYGLTGPVGWHYSSGMETGLLIAFMLATLYGFVSRRFRFTILFAVLMAITRPEGAILAVMTSGVLVLSAWRTRGVSVLWGLLPVAVLGVQPTVNLLVTGSATAAGSSAKSILSMVPADPMVMARLIEGNFGRMWWEFLTGYSGREGLYLPVGLLVGALAGVVLLVWRERRIWLVLLVVGWLGAGTAAVSTLDPAFWHFKRYQMPFMALLFPLAAWGLVRLPKWVSYGVLVLWVVSALVSSMAFFQPAYGLNVGYLREQQVPMARWLRENTPDDAVVAVHDVGLMRYLGERTTVDMVGLTTAGAAESWRNGPGALAEFLSEYEPRPNYVASYTDALGLSYLVDTGLYGELLAEFPAEPSDRYNVALAGAYQGVWRIDWSNVAGADEIGFDTYADYVSGADLVDAVDVGSLTSEIAHGYQWSNEGRLPGFPTEVYELAYPDGRVVLDGGRLINGEERFTVMLESGRDAVLVTRLHPRNAGTFQVFVDGQTVASRTIASIPGQWVDVATQIDGEMIVEVATLITIVLDTPGGHYMPYQHWVYQGDFPEAATISDDALAVFDGFALDAVVLTPDVEALAVQMDWLKAVEKQPGDYRVFAHVYDDLDTAPVAQADRYPLNGALPPGNWLPGELSDTIMVNLAELAPGRYRVAVGLYDPNTGIRQVPSGGQGTFTDDGRILVGEIEVE